MLATPSPSLVLVLFGNSGAWIIRSVGNGVQRQAGDRASVSCLVTG
jgi:hypothetical protein